MHTKDTLGIIVNSNRYFDFVTHLAKAAVDHDKAVHIHLLGEGCEFAATKACNRLSCQAQITMCAKSVRQMIQKDVEQAKDRISLVPSQELTKLLEQCDRHVVF